MNYNINIIFRRIPFEQVFWFPQIQVLQSNYLFSTFFLISRKKERKKIKLELFK